ncbi:MAG: universal stress protein [Candidatus Rokubacteria bacterium]|nr:universal stress protein [Candidatus Rokubacteria bacterium]
MKVLHPTDFSETAQRAEAVAVELLRGLGGELVLLHVAVRAPLYNERVFGAAHVERVYEAQREWAEMELAKHVAALGQACIAACWEIRSGAPADEIVDAAVKAHADMIVIGTHGRSGLPRLLLGSVADGADG